MAALAGPSVYYMGAAVGPLLLGWVAPLAILAWEGEADVDAFPIPSLDGRLLVAMWLVAAIGLWIVFLPPGHRPIIHDEPLYLLQSQHIWRRPFMRPLDQALTPFFVIEQSYSASGYMNGQYPPGWPLVLSMASTLPAAWVVVFGVYALLVLATYAFGCVARIARRIVRRGPRHVQRLDARLGDMSMPHVLEAARALIAGTLMVGSARATRRWRLAAWALAGLVLGFAIAVRPLTGVALAAALWLWVLLRERPAPRAAVAATLAACAGGVIPIAFLMHYNLQTTGAVLRFGYDLAEHGMHALGFGRRGFVEYTTTGVPVERAFTFSPLLALRYAGDNLRVGLSDFFTTGILIVPIAYVALRSGVQWRWRRIAAFLVLPLAYFFYFFHNAGWLPRPVLLRDFSVRHGRRRVPCARGGAAAPDRGDCSGRLICRDDARRYRDHGDQTPRPPDAFGRCVRRRRAAAGTALETAGIRSRGSPSAGSRPGIGTNPAVGRAGCCSTCIGTTCTDFRRTSSSRATWARAIRSSARRFPEWYAVLLTVRPAPPGGEPWLIEANPLESREAVRTQ